ncbi:MAG: phytanoyl-CoA dioxygenase family protein [Actinomycetota bacterium]
MVSQHDVTQFVDNGYLVVEDLVSPAEIAALIADAARFARGDYPVLNPPTLPPDATDDVALEHVLAIHFPHWVSDVARDMVTHPGVTEVVGSLAGAHLAHWDGAVKCCQSILFVKGPGMPGQAWHQDERYIATRDRSLIGAWIALDDATVDNGCLWVVPGSHRSGYLWPAKAHENPDEYDISDESYGFDDAGAIPVEVKAGSVVFFNGYTLHRSLANRTQGFRRALVNHYLNAWSLLPWKTNGSVPGLALPLLDNRDVVPVGTDPYAWKGYAPTPSKVVLRPIDGVWPDTESVATI